RAKRLPAKCVASMREGAWPRFQAPPLTRQSRAATALRLSSPLTVATTPAVSKLPYADADTSVARFSAWAVAAAAAVMAAAVMAAARIGEGFIARADSGTRV